MKYIIFSMVKINKKVSIKFKGKGAAKNGKR